MNFSGIIIGIASFLIIGLCHPLVIKAEYYFSKNVWPLFLVGGIAACAGALFVAHYVVSALLAVAGFSLFWSIKELFEQEERVKKGWFPKRPGRE